MQRKCRPGTGKTGEVAQAGSLLCRRLAIGRGWSGGARRRLATCETADYQSAPPAERDSAPRRADLSRRNEMKAEARGKREGWERSSVAGKCWWPRAKRLTKGARGRVAFCGFPSPSRLGLASLRQRPMLAPTQPGLQSSPRRSPRAIPPAPALPSRNR